MKLSPRTEYNLTRFAIYTAIAIVSAYLFISCGSRKVETNKQSEKTDTKEVTDTNTKETIQETVTTKIDTTITVPKHVAKSEAPISIITESDPLIYEDEHIKSVTKYNRNTGVLSNEVTRKSINIPVKAESVTNRNIERETAVKSDKETSTEKQGKVKQSERESSWSWLVWVLIALIAILVFWWLVVVRKRKEGSNV